MIYFACPWFSDDNRKSSGMKILTANRDYIKNWILDVERCALEQKNKSAEVILKSHVQSFRPLLIRNYMNFVYQVDYCF